MHRHRLLLAVCGIAIALAPASVAGQGGAKPAGVVLLEAFEHGREAWRPGVGSTL